MGMSICDWMTLKNLFLTRRMFPESCPQLETEHLISCIESTGWLSTETKLNGVFGRLGETPHHPLNILHEIVLTWTVDRQISTRLEEQTKERITESNRIVPTWNLGRRISSTLEKKSRLLLFSDTYFLTWESDQKHLADSYDNKHPCLVSRINFT